jgi:hypothetical protein
MCKFPCLFNFSIQCRLAESLGGRHVHHIYFAECLAGGHVYMYTWQSVWQVGVSTMYTWQNVWQVGVSTIYTLQNVWQVGLSTCIPGRVSGRWACLHVYLAECLAGGRVHHIYFAECLAGGRVYMYTWQSVWQVGVSTYIPGRVSGRWACLPCLPGRMSGR